MAYTKEELDRIHASTNGRCHLTGTPVARSDYGKTWEVDHSKAKALGGTNHINNLRPALIQANRSKQTKTAAEVRKANGLTHAPMSKKQVERKTAGAVGGTVLGLLGGVLLGATGLGLFLFGAAGAGVGWKLTK